MQPIDEAVLPHAFLNAPLYSHSSPQPGLVAAYGQISVQTSDYHRCLTPNMTDPSLIKRLLVAHANCGVLCLTLQLFGGASPQLIGQFCVLLVRTWRLGLGSSSGRGWAWGQTRGWGKGLERSSRVWLGSKPMLWLHSGRWVWQVARRGRPGRAVFASRGYNFGLLEAILLVLEGFGGGTEARSRVPDHLSRPYRRCPPKKSSCLVDQLALVVMA